MTTEPLASDPTELRRDLVVENDHPMNIGTPSTQPSPEGERVSRPPLYEVYMRMAEELAKRSTCIRLQVGTVITDASLEHVLAIGYNGNARGFPNTCDSSVPGACGCIHSEMNALVKAPGDVPSKVAFVTASPCVMCAKLMVQAKVAHVFYRKAYRRRGGLDVLAQAGVSSIHYTRWKETQW